MSDKGSNVDGETVREICENLHIEKRRTSGYHAQGNGFAERQNRTALLDKDLPSPYWESILDSMIFAINSSPSKSIKCAPFEVVFGRKPNLPIDNYFNTKLEYTKARSPKEYMEDVKVQLFDIINHVANSLRIAREKMVLHVWLQKKTFKSDENTV